MQLLDHKLEMSCHLILSEEETKMLGHLAAYSGTAIAKAISQELTGKYSVQSWEKLWSDLRSQLESADRRFQDTRSVFRGIKRAATLLPDEG